MEALVTCCFFMASSLSGMKEGIEVVSVGDVRSFRLRATIKRDRCAVIVRVKISILLIQEWISNLGASINVLSITRAINHAVAGCVKPLVRREAHASATFGLKTLSEVIFSLLLTTVVAVIVSASVALGVDPSLIAMALVGTLRRWRWYRNLLHHRRHHHLMHRLQEPE